MSRMGGRRLQAMLPGIGADPRWLEAASAASALLWGASVLWLSGGLGRHPAYAPLAAFLPLASWGALFLAGGVLQAAAVLADDAMARVPLAAAVGSGWLLVAYDLAAAAPGAPTAAVLAVLGAGDGAAMLILIGLAWRRRA